jgi:hypothetical protein
MDGSSPDFSFNSSFLDFVHNSDHLKARRDLYVRVAF